MAPWRLERMALHFNHVPMWETLEPNIDLIR
jgi:hypothetical protein